MQVATSNHTLVQDSKSRIGIRAGVEASHERAASCINRYNEEVSIDVSNGLSETSEECPGTRTVANFLRQSVSRLNPEHAGKKRKEKRNYEVARKWEKSDSIVSQLI